VLFEIPFQERFVFRGEGVGDGDGNSSPPSKATDALAASADGSRWRMRMVVTGAFPSKIVGINRGGRSLY